MKDILSYLRHPSKIVIALSARGYLPFLSDKLYLKIIFKYNLHYSLNIDSPKTFNEKIQWLKLYDRKTAYTTMVDKSLVKNYVAKIIGEKYIIPTLGIWDSFDAIDFTKLPNAFVIKCTHDSGGLVIVPNKEELDIDNARKKISKCLKRNFYYVGREWPYKNVTPRIIAEKYLSDGKHLVPEDYKVYCFNGIPKYIVIFHNRFDNVHVATESVYDTEWNKLNVSLDEHFEISDTYDERPTCLNELLNVCTKLAKGFPLLRLDFYIIGNRLYFGEITFHTASGFQAMIPKELDEQLGLEILLPYETNSNEIN